MARRCQRTTTASASRFTGATFGTRPIEVDCATSPAYLRGVAGRPPKPQRPLWPLRERLRVARAAGVPFDEAWSLAGEFMEPAIRDSTRPAWERAYCGEPPTPAEEAVARLGVVFERAGV